MGCGCMRTCGRSSAVARITLYNICLMKRIVIVFILSCLSACRVTESSLVGSYYRKGATKTALTLNRNGSFYFILRNPDPFILGNVCVFTTGGWSVVNQKLRLESLPDSITLPSITVQRKENSVPGLSTFTFFDTSGDSVRISGVEYSDGSITAKMHGLMPYFREDLSKRDTLMFYGYGYKPWMFISGQRINQDYQVTLVPEYQPRFFKNDEFEVKGGRLVNDYLQLQFKRRKD
jgi:hypothetical protein